MRKLIPALICMALLFLLTAAGAEGVNRALLIGCDDFVTEADTTPAAANNVELMARALSGGSMNPVTMVTQRRGIPDPESFRLLVKDAFRNAGPEDTSYIYISTHGRMDAEGRFVLVLSNGQRESEISGAELKEILSGIAGRKVLILDACQSGALLGKGMAEPGENLFAGPDYVVICSSGGAEASWLWTDAEQNGQGYFSGILAAGISSGGGFSADENGDGDITLTELRRYLYQHCGESTVQTYPEESDISILSYSAEAYQERRRTAVLDSISFEEGALDAEYPACALSFTVVSAARIGYRIICMHEGTWDFSGAVSFWDQEGEDGILQPGRYERTILLQENTAGGYALLQLITQQNEETKVASSHILCVPPADGDPGFAITAPASFSGELSFCVKHTLPCDLTVTIETPEGEILRRLCSGQATRPQQVGGTCLTWSGLDMEGNRTSAAACVIRVRTTLGGKVWESVSEVISIEP